MRRVVNQLITHGRVVRPTLGVEVAEDAITRRVAHSLRRDLDGTLVVEVHRTLPLTLSASLSLPLTPSLPLTLSLTLTPTVTVTVTVTLTLTLTRCS